MRQYEVVVDLGGRTFASGTWWHVAAAGILLAAAFALMLRVVRSNDRLTYRLIYATCAGIAAALIVPALATIHQTTSEHRLETETKAITDKSGYHFFGDRTYPTDSPLQNFPVIMQNDTTVQNCYLSMWYQNRKSGQWMTQLSKNWRDNSNTVKIQLLCPSVP